MLVDDHAAFRHLVRTLLQPLQAESVECQDGQEAVEAYPQSRPDVVLMDIAMKGMTGLKATALLAARFPEARIYMLTEYDHPDLRAAARQAGALGYLLKDDLSQLQTLLSSPPIAS